jgi:hypothetical protein
MTLATRQAASRDGVQVFSLAVFFRESLRVYLDAPTTATVPVTRSRTESEG